MNRLTSSENSTNAQGGRNNPPILIWIIGFIIVVIVSALIILTALSVKNQKTTTTIVNKQSNENSTRGDLGSITEGVVKNSNNGLKNTNANTNKQTDEVSEDIPADINTTNEGLIAISRNFISWQQPKEWQIFLDEAVISRSGEPTGEFMISTGTARAVNGAENPGIHASISDSEIIFAHGAAPLLETATNTFGNLTITRSHYGESNFENILYRVSDSATLKKAYLDCMFGGKDNINIGTNQCDALAQSFSFLPSQGK